MSFLNGLHNYIARSESCRQLIASQADFYLSKKSIVQYYKDAKHSVEDSVISLILLENDHSLLKQLLVEIPIEELLTHHNQLLRTLAQSFIDSNSP